VEIRVGWATEFGREKFDVSMDEADLRRVLNNAGIDPEAAVLMSSSEVFDLLEREARMFADFESVRYITDGVQHAKVLERVRALQAAQTAFLERLKVNFTPDGGSGYDTTDEALTSQPIA
jgi:hypothetical protein